MLCGKPRVSDLRKDPLEAHLQSGPSVIAGQVISSVDEGQECIYWLVPLSLLLLSSYSRISLTTHSHSQRLPNNHTLLSLDKMHFKLTSFFTMAICATLALAGPIEKRCDPNDAAAVAGCHDCTANCVNNANPYAQAGCYAGNASLYSDTMIVY